MRRNFVPSSKGNTLMLHGRRRDELELASPVRAMFRIKRGLSLVSSIRSRILVEMTRELKKGKLGRAWVTNSMQQIRKVPHSSRMSAIAMVV